MRVIELPDELLAVDDDVVGRYVKHVLSLAVPGSAKVVLSLADEKALIAARALPAQAVLFGEDGGDKITPSGLMALWNTLGDPFPKVMKMTADRATKARSRIAEIPHRGDWEDIIQRIRQSDWHRGCNSSGWVATFDWLVRNATTPMRILEGATCRKTLAGAMRESQQEGKDEEPSLSRL